MAWIPSLRGLASRDDENKVGGCADMGQRAMIGYLANEIHDSLNKF